MFTLTHSEALQSFISLHTPISSKMLRTRMATRLPPPPALPPIEQTADQSKETAAITLCVVHSANFTFFLLCFVVAVVDAAEHAVLTFLSSCCLAATLSLLPPLSSHRDVTAASHCVKYGRCFHVVFIGV